MSSESQVKLSLTIEIHFKPFVKFFGRVNLFIDMEFDSTEIPNKIRSYAT